MFKPGQLRLIGIGYQIGVGKDTVADYMCATFGFRKMRFADPLKEAVAAIYGWSRESLEEQEFKATVDKFWGITPRTALQLVGTEAMRNNVDKDIWIKAMQRRLSSYAASNKDPSVVVTDTRFINEVETIKEMGGKVIRVIRPDNEFTTGGAVGQHASELELDGYDDWDYTIINDGDLKKLRIEIDKAMITLDLFYESTR